MICSSMVIERYNIMLIITLQCVFTKYILLIDASNAFDWLYHHKLCMSDTLFNNIYKRDIKWLVSDFDKHSNAVIVSFNGCDSQIFSYLHSMLWSSLYGTEFFNYSI